MGMGGEWNSMPYEFAVRCLYLPHILAFHLRPLELPFISEDSKEGVCQYKHKTETPNEGDGVEKVRIAGAGVDPEMVKGRPEESSVEEGGDGEEGIAQDCSGVSLGS